MTRIASGTYLAELVRRPSDWPDKIERTLTRDGSWSAWNEWRIGTVTEERIERVLEGYEVSSACDLRFTARLPSLEDALAARRIFALLHGHLFYSFGWPSWAGYMRMKPEDAARAPYSEDAEPYLVQLYEEAIGELEPRFEEINRAIEQDGVWAEGGKEIRSADGYPEIAADGTESVVPEAWFEVSVRRAAVEVGWKSPTYERAALFVGILDRVLTNLIQAGVWSEPSVESAG